MEADNINPDYWGPSLWTAIHYIALSYPIKPTPFHKENFRQFFVILKDIIPCEKCREHYKANLKKNSLHQSLESKQSLFNWTVDVHNVVNKIHNKKTISYKEARKIYMNANLSYLCKNNKNNKDKSNTNNNSNYNKHYRTRKKSNKKVYYISFIIICLIVLIIFIKFRTN